MHRLISMLVLLGCTRTPEPVPATDQPAAHLLDDMPADAVVAGGMPSEGVVRDIYRMSSPVVLTGGSPAQSIEVPITAEQSYRIAASVQTTGLEVAAGGVGASIEIEELSESGEVLARHSHLPRLRGTQSAQQLQAQLAARPSAAMLKIYLHPGGPDAAGSVRFSDLEVLGLPAIRHTLSARPWSGDTRTRMVELHEDTRPALVLSVGTQVNFDHGIHPQATLRFAVAQAPGVPGEVCVEALQAGERVVAQCTSDAQWTDVSASVPAEGPIQFSVQGNPGGVVLLADPRVIPQGRRPGPNVVVITLDTLRADALSVYGAQRAAPAIEAFSAKSIVYDHAFSVSGWTAPSLASMVTSTMPAEHGAGSRVPREVAQTRESTGQNRKNQLNYRGMKQTGLTSVAEVFRDAGYQTVGFYTNYFFSEALGFARGFGRYHRFKGGGWSGGKSGVKLMRAWLDERKREGPFFMSLHFVDPHTPYHLRKDVTPDLWPHHPDAPDIKVRDKQGVARFTRFQPQTRKYYEHVMPFYESEVAYMDGLLADVFEMLDGLDNTVVLVTSDHGEAFKEHGLLIHGNSLYQELLHIPMILRLPDGSRAGSRDPSPVSLIDVAPTLVDLAGLSRPEGWIGASLLSSPADRTLLMESVYSGADQFAAVQWPYKLIWRPAERHVGFAVHKKSQIKLFDLVKDPGEKKNLRKKRPKIRAKLKRALDAHVAQTSGWHLRCTPGDSPFSVTLQASGSMGQIADLSLEADDVSALSSDARTLNLTVEPSHEGDQRDWLAIRSRQPGFSVTAQGVPQVDAPADAPVGSCVLWQQTLDAEDLGGKVGAQGMEELRALGYVD